MIAITATVVPVAEQQPAQPGIDLVKTLYESAAYDEALGIVEQLSQQSPGPAEGRLRSATVERYRALCLLALNRGSEAEQVIERMVMANVDSRPDPNDTPPRLVSAIEQVRTRVLPLQAREHYDIAKAYFDQKQHADAAREFARVIDLLDDPAFESWNATTRDLRPLATGFLELSRAAISKPMPTAPAAPEPAPAAAPTTYSGTDTDVVQPVVIRQDVPPWIPPRMDVAVSFSGLMSIVIDEKGQVESADVVKSVNYKYDRLLIAASKRWSYSPATKDGLPVRFRKNIVIQLSNQHTPITK
jgi:TonB family protein